MDIDIALFSAGGSISEKYAPIAAQHGVTVVDNSSAWRMDKEVPLVVPEVNPQDVEWNKGIIANPNCSTIQAMVVLKPLHDKYKIKRVIYSTYQAVSGSGVKGISDLEEGLKGNDKSEATTVRVPVFDSHSESINIEFEKPIDVDEVRETLANFPGIVVQDDPANNVYPLAREAAGHNEVYVGRIRRDFSVENGINLWVVSDNIRKGAATNAVQIAEELIK